MEGLQQIHWFCCDFHLLFPTPILEAHSEHIHDAGVRGETAPISLPGLTCLTESEYSFGQGTRRGICADTV